MCVCLFICGCARVYSSCLRSQIADEELQLAAIHDMKREREHHLAAILTPHLVHAPMMGTAMAEQYDDPDAAIMKVVVVYVCVCVTEREIVRMYVCLCACACVRRRTCAYACACAYACDCI